MDGAGYEEIQAGQAANLPFAVDSARRTSDDSRVRLLRAWEGADRNLERSGCGERIEMG